MSQEHRDRAVDSCRQPRGHCLLLCWIGMSQIPGATAPADTVQLFAAALVVLRVIARPTLFQIVLYEMLPALHRRLLGTQASSLSRVCSGVEAGTRGSGRTFARAVLPPSPPPHVPNPRGSGCGLRADLKQLRRAELGWTALLSRSGPHADHNTSSGWSRPPHCTVQMKGGDGRRPASIEPPWLEVKT